jgi:hypothetical protein
MKDGYQEFFDNFKINFEEVIEYGVREATVFPDPRLIKSEWGDLKKEVLSKGVVYIRGYGRDASGFDLYQEFYSTLFEGLIVKKDPSNNSKPTQLLQRITKFSKSISVKSKNGNKPIRNYQVAHIFGRTKNPFLFTAPWNIVWTPRIFDPFTGHESRGDDAVKYQKHFLNHAKDIYKDYIHEYNDLSRKYFKDSVVNAILNKMRVKYGVDRNIEKFILDIKKELGPIM